MIELELIEELFTSEQTRQIMIRLMDEIDLIAAGLGRKISLEENERQ